MLHQDEDIEVLTSSRRTIQDDTLRRLNPHFFIILRMSKWQLNRFLNQTYNSKIFIYQYVMERPVNNNNGQDHATQEDSWPMAVLWQLLFTCHRHRLQLVDYLSIKSHYGENDGNGEPMFMAWNVTANNRSHLNSYTKRKWRTSNFPESTFSPLHRLAPFPRSKESPSESGDTFWIAIGVCTRAA